LIEIDGVPIMLIDTAGIRESNDTVESIGVERARREAADADLLIVVIDGSNDLSDEDQVVLSEAHDARYVVALNKSDLPAFSAGRLQQCPNGNASVVPVSAKSESGLESLRSAIMQPFATNGIGDNNGILVTNARHHDLLQRSVESIDSSRSLLQTHASEELVLVGLHNALHYLGEITGETTPDEILGKIFSTFCIGK
jgi:tRNA modification GTPase